MSSTNATILIVLAALTFGSWQAVCAAEQAHAILINTDGKLVGKVHLHQTPNGVLLRARLSDFPPGAHAFHVHAVGSCEAPFKSAGGHFNPDGSAHGILAAAGPHAGDLPNVHVGESGKLEVEILNERLKLDAALFDDDGAAIVIHAGGDDYVTDPAGAAGARIACGVIERQ